MRLLQQLLSLLLLLLQLRSLLLQLQSTKRQLLTCTSRACGLWMLGRHPMGGDTGSWLCRSSLQRAGLL